MEKLRTLLKTVPATERRLPTQALHRLLIQLNHLDTIPEGSPGHPGISLLINDEVRGMTASRKRQNCEERTAMDW